MKKKNPHAQALGRKGGKARLKTLTAEQRKTIAIKASKAAAKARRAKAQKQSGGNSGS